MDSSHYEFGLVSYHDRLEEAPELEIDFSESIAPPGAGLRQKVLKLGFHKRSCFSYEHEWRAILYQDYRPEIAGVHESFDLDELISAVHVGPRAHEFVLEALSLTMDKFDLRKPTSQSNLLRTQRKGLNDMYGP